jgi:uncharacterized protein (UPF0548 family)
MRSDLLSAGVVAELRAASFSYTEVGATKGPLPAGYHHLRRDVDLGVGRTYLQAARAALFGWHVHRLAGLRLSASSLEIEPETVAVVRIGVGPVALRAPVRVVYLVDEPDQAGFAYGTLPGHPESGEEAFMITMDPDERVRFALTAFSKPGTRLAQGAGPLGRAMQSRITERYLEAMINYTRPESRRG